MKKKTGILLGLLPLLLNVSVVIAANNLPGLARSGQYKRDMRTGIIQLGPVQHLPDTVYSVGTYPLYTPELADGKGREIVQISCRFCHSTTYITMQPPLPAAIWKAEVDKMINTYGAPVPEDEAKLIISYLQAHYSPETRK
ncbi:MAG: sulfide dehydrogenase [Candidatus Kuenenia sp.]|nr:sulfide dehydrogenase [Candidatus Kuenenia hertensis]